MNTSPLSYLKQDFEELPKAFEALFEESIKMAKRNVESKKKVKKGDYGERSNRERVGSYRKAFGLSLKGKLDQYKLKGGTCTEK